MVRSLGRTAVGTLGLKLVGTGLAFIANLLVARRIGVDAFGAYSFCTTCLVVLCILSTAGWDQLLVREIASAKATGDRSQLGLVIAAATRAVCLATPVVAALSLGLFAATGDSLVAGRGLLILTVVIGLPTLTAYTVLDAVLRGAHRVWTSQVTSAVLQPMCLLGAVVALGIGFQQSTATIVAFVVSWFPVIIIDVAALWRIVFTDSVQRVGRAPGARIQRSEGVSWRRSARPLLALSVFQVVNVRLPQLVLGSISSGKELGIYAVSSRAAELVAFPLVAMNLSLAPRLSTLFAQNQRGEVARTCRHGARLALLPAALAAACLLAGATIYLSLFGSGFRGGEAVVRVLVVGQLANVAFGPTNVLLAAGRKENILPLGIGIGVVLDLALAVALVPAHGALGAAAAYATSLIVWNAILLRLGVRHLGINPSSWSRADVSA